MAMNILADALQARQAGFGEMEDIRARVAKNAAGRRLASGDYAGAKAAAYGAGSLEIGSGIQRMEDQQEDRAAAAQADQQSQEMAAQKQRAATLEQVSTALMEVPAGQRKQTLDRLGPVFEKIGTDPSVFASLTEEDLTDVNLQAFGAEMKKAAEGYTLQPGAKRFGPDNQLVAEAPFAPSYQKVGEGDQLFQFGGDRKSGGKSGVQDVLQSIVGAGGKITSGQRSPAHNKAVGGAPNSYHLAGRAADLTPPPGVSMEQLEARLRASGVNFAELINEGDHIHVAWDDDGGGGDGGRLVAQGPPKAKAQVQMLTPAEVQAAGFLPGTVVQRGENGKLDVVQSPNNNASPRKAEGELRKQFDALPEIKEYREISNAYRNVSAAARNPSAAGDLSLIFGFMKMLDPTSVVREGEFATAQNAAGVPDQIRNMANRVVNGQRLNNQQRADFVRQAQSIYQSRKGRFEEITKQYRGYANDYGVDPDRVAPIEGAAGGGTRRAPGWTQRLPAPQRAALAKFRNASGPVGSVGNPYVPASEVEYNRLPKGARYIHPDGTVKVKG